MISWLLFFFSFGLRPKFIVLSVLYVARNPNMLKDVQGPQEGQKGREAQGLEL